MNARAGATYWAAQRIGLRIEYVEHLHAYLDENSRLAVLGDQLPRWYSALVPNSAHTVTL